MNSIAGLIYSSIGWKVCLWDVCMGRRLYIYISYVIIIPYVMWVCMYVLTHLLIKEGWRRLVSGTWKTVKYHHRMRVHEITCTCHTHAPPPLILNFYILSLFSPSLRFSPPHTSSILTQGTGTGTGGNGCKHGELLCKEERQEEENAEYWM